MRFPLAHMGALLSSVLAAQFLITSSSLSASFPISMQSSYSSLGFPAVMQTWQNFRSLSPRIRRISLIKIVLSVKSRELHDEDFKQHDSPAACPANSHQESLQPKVKANHGSFCGSETMYLRLSVAPPCHLPQAKIVDSPSQCWALVHASALRFASIFGSGRAD